MSWMEVRSGPTCTLRSFRPMRPRSWLTCTTFSKATCLPTSRAGPSSTAATRMNAEKVAEFLNDKGTQADHFHAGLTPERKKQVQDDFIEGRLKAIAATNAFGMGIDKPDVRLVIHADIPGSLENYLQEARPGRQGQRRRPLRAALHQRGHREAVRHDRPVPA